MADGLQGAAQRRTDNPSLRRLAYFLWGEFRGKVEGHEILDGRIDCLQLSLVAQGLFGSSDWRFEVGLAYMADMR